MVDQLSKVNNPSGLFKANGVDYLLPPTQQAGPLLDDGAGNLLWGTSPYQNAVPNGDFGVWRRGTPWSFTGAGAGFFADNWSWNATTGGYAITIAQDTSVPTVSANALNAKYSAKLTVQTIPTLGVSDSYVWQARILGYDYRALTNGFCGSFCVFAHRTGTYSLSFRNFNSDRIYVVDYTVSVADTWEYKTFVVPKPPTAGTWNYDAGTGLIVSICLALGTNTKTAPGVWTTGNFRGSTNQINGLAATSDVFALALLNVIPGATPQPCMPSPYAITSMILDAPSPSAEVVGSTAVAGVGPQPALFDHVHAMPGTGTPTTIAFGDAATAGAGPSVAYSNHVHGMPVAAAYNAITNPGCNIFQIGNSGAAAADTTTWADAWRWFQSGGGAVQHTAFAQNAVFGGISINYAGDILKMNTTTADTSIGSTEYYMLRQGIEGYNAQALGSGMSLSFYLFAVKAGIYSVSLATRSGGQIYVMEANIAANTWTYFAFPNIPAPSSWQGDMRTQTGLYLRLLMAAGSSFQTSTINAWNSGGFFASTNQVNGVDAVNNAVYLYGVNLVPGPYAVPYRPQDYQAELARAMRYRQVLSHGLANEIYGAGQADSTTHAYIPRALSVPMPAAPAGTFSAANTFEMLTAAGGVQACTTISLTLGSGLHINFNCATAAGLVAGNSTLLLDAAGASSVVLESYPA